MTAKAMEGDREACLAAGMDDYVSKPIRAETLGSALERCVPIADAQNPAGQTVLDGGTLAALREIAGDDQIVAELIDAFLGEIPDLLRALRGAEESREADVLRRLAHTLKSNARTFGAQTLAQRCAELESLARESHLGPDSAGLVAAIDDELACVARALRQSGVPA